MCAGDGRNRRQIRVRAAANRPDVDAAFALLLGDRGLDGIGNLFDEIARDHAG